MTLAPDAAYRVLQTHDARFDGRLFVGVTTTQIYCRPVCRVRLPLQRNCRFFGHAAAAEAQGFRPCLRCRPELAPGLALIDSSGTLAGQAAALLDRAAHSGDTAPLPAIAARLGVTDRHLRRIFAAAHGVAPIDYLTTRRLLLAKQLLTDTALPITQVAMAAGFASLRRFNAVFLERYRLSPSALRRGPGRAAPGNVTPGNVTTGRTAPAAAGIARKRSGSSASVQDIAAASPLADSIALRLAWREPYDMAGVLGFFSRRAIAGMELVQGQVMRRTLALAQTGQAPDCAVRGWLQLHFDGKAGGLELRLSNSLLPALGAVLASTRHALDLDAEPALIDPVLHDATFTRLGAAACPGLRLPSGWDGFEMATRVILGQQVSVAAAQTLTRRLVERFGQPITTPFADLNRLFPSAQAIAQATPEAIGTLGIVRQRVKALQALAVEVATGRLRLHRAAAVQPTLDALLALPGIGHWSAQLIAMRALAWPDAWPATDIGILNALRPITTTRDAAQATALAEAWRPWRAYAVMKLWASLEQGRPLHGEPLDNLRGKS